MKILTVLTYYRPHTSGLTIYAERLVQALARRGHQVTVLTTQYDKTLPLSEVQDNVHIVRLPVVVRINKGVLAPSFGAVSTRMVLEHDAVLLHLPQFDAAGVALRGRLFRRPTVVLYHSDLLLPPGLFNRFVNVVVDFMNNLAGTFAHRIVAYTDDFAQNSPYLTRFAHKREVVLPNVYLPPATAEAIAAFRQRYNPDGRPIIGMATRFAAEKGVEVLLEAFPAVLERFPNARVLFAGQYQGVWGESSYAESLMPIIQKYQQEGRWQFLGVQTLEQMAAFFPNLSVLVVPSLNSTETFGFVQIEAMMNGVPVVASNLPGVRVPVGLTGMGRVIPVGDAQALSSAILEILSSSGDPAVDPAAASFRQGVKISDPDQIRQMFHPDTNAAAFERIFERLHEQLGRPGDRLSDRLSGRLSGRRQKR